MYYYQYWRLHNGNEIIREGKKTEYKQENGQIITVGSLKYINEFIVKTVIMR